MQLTDKITLATPEQRQQTDTLYNAACKVVSSLAIDETQQLNTLAITRRVDHYTIAWQRLRRTDLQDQPRLQLHHTRDTLGRNGVMICCLCGMGWRWQDGSQ